MPIIKKYTQQFRNLKLSTKFIAAICAILFVLTILDITYNAAKERKMAQRAANKWTFLFAENVRVSLNTLMREGKMGLRFALFDSLSKELTGLQDIRVIRAKRTNEIFKEVNEKEIIPKLENDVRNYLTEMVALKKRGKKASDPSEIADINEEIAYIKESIELTQKQLKEARRPMSIDERERPRDELEEKVLETGRPLYRFRGDNARAIVPYVAKKKGCSDTVGCHKYAKEGEVLGAISLEFSMEAIHQEIRRNNLKMAGWWSLRFIIFLIVISLLLTFIITRELNVMLKVFKKMTDGDLSVRVPVKGNDEIGQLAMGVNKMAASLEETKVELDRRLLEVFALYNIGKVLNTSFETEKVLLQLVKDISKSENIDRIAIMLVDERKGDLYVATQTGFEDRDMSSIRRKIGEGFYGLAASTGKKRLVQEVDKEKNVPLEDIFSPRINSILAVPFFRRGAVLGLICAFKDKPGILETFDLDLFSSVAEQLAVAIENAKSFEETKMKSIQDSLTGLYNKGFFLETLEAEISKAKRFGRELSIFMLDVDDFKHYNDTNGHPEGDDLLIQLSNLIHNSVRSIDFPCRYGGEEFVVILPETDKKGAAVIAEKLGKLIEAHPFPHRKSQPLGFVSVSIGLASYPADSRTIDGLIKKMDEALYKAKKEGKNRLIVA